MRGFAVVLALFVVAFSPKAAAQLNDPATIVNVFSAACAVAERTGPLVESQASALVTREYFMQSGPPPGTFHGVARYVGQQFQLAMRDDDTGFCALRFAPADMRAELDRRFGEGTQIGDRILWQVPRADGQGTVVYRPFGAGQSGPAWIGRPGGWLYGVDSAERFDTLAFYAPPRQ